MWGNPSGFKIGDFTITITITEGYLRMNEIGVGSGVTGSIGWVRLN